MEKDIGELLKHFFRSEEQAACRILGRGRALIRMRAMMRPTISLFPTCLENVDQTVDHKRAAFNEGGG